MIDSPLSAIIFDWGGTLTPWHTISPHDAWITAVPDAEVAARLAAAEIEIWGRTHTDHRSGSLAEVFEVAGVPESEAVTAAFSRWWEPHTFLDPDAPALFDALHERGMRIGVLSNTLWTRAEHERIFARDGVLDRIDGAVYSSEIPWTKPHPEAFRAALAAVNIDDPAHAVFVGDRPFDDIHGAKSVGMRAVLLPHSDIPADQRGPIQGDPDAVVQRLGDVLAVVDGWRSAGN
jgi:putative hydrolase of the HAD superfamily